MSNYILIICNQLVLIKIDRLNGIQILQFDLSTLSKTNKLELTTPIQKLIANITQRTINNKQLTTDDLHLTTHNCQLDNLPTTNRQQTYNQPTTNNKPPTTYSKQQTSNK